MLICRRLNEDHKKYAKYNYLLEVCKKPEEKKLLKSINSNYHPRLHYELLFQELVLQS